jgi:hypothetical protein
MYFARAVHLMYFIVGIIKGGGLPLICQLFFIIVDRLCNGNIIFS